MLHHMPQALVKGCHGTAGRSETAAEALNVVSSAQMSTVDGEDRLQR